MPAYNEERHLAKVLEAVTAAFPEAEIVLVSDGSTDRTPELARGYAPQVTTVHYEPNRGKGHAVRTGMLTARGRIRIFTDADLPFGTEGVAAVYARLRNDPDTDIVIAAKTGIKRGVLYRVARSMARVGIAALTGLRYADTQAGLKGFRGPVAQELYSEARIEGFASDIEILYLAKRKGLQVTALSMAVVGDYGRPSRFGVVAGMRVLRDVGRIRRGR